jgi:hypothetical protein
MPSPFPGMDPYLESPDWFPGLHANLIVFMKGALQRNLQKQRETLGSEIHLVEIDLLRGGAHALAVPKDLVTAQAGSFEYMVSIHRYNRPKEFLVYPITLRLRLPKIAIPLSPGDPHVTLDLQDVFDRSYDFGAYRREIDYGKDRIVPRLKTEQADWATNLIKSRRRKA